MRVLSQSHNRHFVNLCFQNVGLVQIWADFFFVAFFEKIIEPMDI